MPFVAHIAWKGGRGGPLEAAAFALPRRACCEGARPLLPAVATHVKRPADPAASALSASPLASERWQSGRSRRTRNAEYAQVYRGFESLPLRQRPLLTP